MQDYAYRAVEVILNSNKCNLTENIFSMILSNQN